MTNIICKHCGCVIEDEDVFEFNGDYYCEDCKDELFTVCDHCNEWDLRERTYWTDDDYYLCEDCYENHTFTCDHCGETLYHASGGEVITEYSTEEWCGYCCENHAHYCDHCGTVVSDQYFDYDHDCCVECVPDSTIHDYSYKPTPVFFGEGANRYFGLELEIEADDADDAANYIDSDFGNYVYCKRDGSLGCEGVEIVSHPMTLQYHLETMKWKEMLKELVEMGSESHNPGTCGLHIHINRTTFGEDPETQYKNIANLVYLTEKFADKLTKFSRRKPEQLERWAQFLNTTARGYIADRVQYPAGRYYAVNLMNRNTVELRLWRGTLKYNTFVATLQLTDALITAAIEDTNLEELTWDVFINTYANTDEIKQYMTERKMIPQNA